MPNQTVEIIRFGNQSTIDKRLLKKFVNFHWTHYVNDSQYIPLLDYEYLGFRLIGIKGFFEPDNLFFKHADMVWFLALQEDNVVGRCIAFINYNHNKHWQDKTGFFGLFECIEDDQIAAQLLDAAKSWLKSQGMTTMRGPLNLPVNEATPGVLTEGFNSRPVMYYHYNKPYYLTLLQNYGLKPVKRVLSWEVRVKDTFPEKIKRLAQKIIDRYNVRLENWGERSVNERKHEMLMIYNEAWNNNWGFVPFTQEEFFRIIDDMMLIMDRQMFTFLYIKDEPAAFIGAVPNVTEKLTPVSWCRRCELVRAVQMLLGANRTQGFRLGYMGVRPKFRRLGLDGVMLQCLKKYADKKQYNYCDMGWVLEDNTMTIRAINLFEAKVSKIYTVLETEIS
ncbi:hypothetical protein JW835_00490 [bacterium]|nr:hypothetical protein [bacterium]